MATQSFTSANKTKRTQLDHTLVVWENRYKLRVLSKNLPRAAMVGVIVSITIGLFGYWQGLLLARELAVLAMVICGVAGLVTIVHTQLFPRERLVAARYYDVEFGLKERLSTALELLDGRIKTHPEIETMQIDDAVAVASGIDHKADIEMDFRPRELFALFLLLVALAVLIIVPLLIGQSGRNETPSAAVVAAQEDVREITETIATDTDLDEIDRQELLEALEVALERLEEQDISDEEAFAAMSQLESEIEEVENQISQQQELDQTALDAASEAIQNQLPTPQEEENAQESQTSGEELAGTEQLSDALNQLSEDAGEMSEDEAQSAADALRDAAQELLERNPELAQALQNAADALENGDSESLRDQLQQAQNELSQMQQQMNQNSDAQQTLQQGQQQAQQSADEISQQQQQQQQNGQQQQGQQQSQQQQGAQQSGENPSDSQPQEGSNSEGQPTDGEAQMSQEGDASNSQPSNSSQDGEGESADSNSSDASGQGAGEGEASNTAMSGSGGEDEGADTDNETTGEGQIEYEAIYSPTGITGGGNEEIILETDASDQPLAEGEFDDNPLGDSQVTYDTVFNDYQDAANRALESDYVPLGLRDIVREYFTSLEPE